jgi:hypothetical protein
MVCIYSKIDLKRQGAQRTINTMKDTKSTPHS